MKFMSGFRQDTKHAVRSLAKRPGFMLVAVFTLAIGIGAVTTIFSLVNGIILKRLPYEESAELVVMWEKLLSFENASVSYPNFTDWRAQNAVFDDIAAYNGMGLNLTGRGNPEELSACRISASMFPVLGIEPIRGRNFLDEEDKIGGERVTILSYGTWQERFGADPEIVGKVITLDEEPWTIIGVTPREPIFPPSWNNLDLYVPIEQYATNWVNQRGNHPGIYVIGRMKDGMTIERARGDMERVAIHLEEEYPENQGNRVHVYQLHENMIDDSRGPLMLLLIAVAFLLMIACVNVSNLLLARVTSRQHEIAIRSTLGAGGRHIIRLLLIESLVLWLLGGIAGIGVAHISIRILASLGAETMPSVFSIGIDLRVISIALATALITGLLFGLAPALRSIRPNLQEYLKEGSRTSSGTRRHRLRNSLIISEVTLALVLLIGAGLMIRSFQLLAGGDPGLEAENVLSLEIPLPELKYAEEEQQAAFFNQLLERVRNLPGVVTAASTYIIPLGPNNWQNGYHVEGTPPLGPGEANYAECNIVSPDYFSAMGIPLLKGRDFTDQNGPDTPNVVIVDESFTELWWPEEDPVGKRFKFGGHDSSNEWMTVIGVAGHVKLYGVARNALEQLYLPYQQFINSNMFLVVRTVSDPSTMTEPIRSEVLALDPLQPMSSVSTMEAYLNETTSDDGFMAILLGIFAAAALLLASVGIYGVMSYITAERRHEMGIRMALGAQSGEVLRLVIWQGMSKVVIGIVAGLILSVVLGRFIESLLFGVTPLDLPTYIIGPVCLAAVALLANVVPAWRMLGVDPVETLRVE